MCYLIHTWSFPFLYRWNTFIFLYYHYCFGFCVTPSNAVGTLQTLHTGITFWHAGGWGCLAHAGDLTWISPNARQISTLPKLVSLWASLILCWTYFNGFVQLGTLGAPCRGWCVYVIIYFRGTVGCVGGCTWVLGLPGRSDLSSTRFIIKHTVILSHMLKKIFGFQIPLMVIRSYSWLCSVITSGIVSRVPCK